MAESSIFWSTNGTGDGVGSGYTAAQLTAAFRHLFSPTANLGGVAPYALNKLAVSGVSSPVAVASGAALGYGFFYENTASENVTIPTPAGSTRIDRIVLRVNWTAQTVRITRIAGTEGAGAPSLTQSAGATWDIPLAQASITTGGVITLTDQREWLTVLGDLMVTTAKLAADAVTFAKMQNITSDRLIGRDTASSGDPEELTVSGGVEFSGSGGIRRSALTGDVTASAGSNATTIANDAVTFAKMQDIATDSLIGRDTAGSGDPENITLNATLSMNGSGALQRAALTGDVTASAGSNATTIANNAVSDAKLRDSAALSVIGRSANSTGDPADIAAGSDGQVLRRSGTALGFGTVATAGIADSAVTGAKIADATIDPATKLNGTNGVVANPSSGNSRGTDAVDLQTERDNATEVASGNFSAILSGENNTASAAHSAVVAGQNGLAERRFSTVHNATQVAGAAVLGQAETVLLHHTTTNATPTELLIGGSGGEKLVLPSTGAIWAFRITVVAARQANETADGAMYTFDGVIRRLSTSTALVGSVSKTVVAEATASMDCNVAANDTDESLDITVTGVAATTINWLARVELTILRSP